MCQRATRRACLYTPITSAYRLDESAAVGNLLSQTQYLEASRTETYNLAHRIATALRNQKASGGKSGVVQELLQEFSLSSKEGIALMCLAEALLRIPDNKTRDALIRDKVAAGDWQLHTGNGSSLFVNAASWGLLITGRLTATRNEAGLGSTLTRLIAKGGEPLIRKGVDMAMRVMGGQFVTGETISEALRNAEHLEKEGFRHSYDMLGEAALTEEDAVRYLKSYEDAIHAIGKRSAGRGIYEGPGISIKLSALHPRYSRAKIDRVAGELYPRLLSLVLLARHYDVGLNIDAEEADRLEISLELLERLCNEPRLAGWNGIGFVIQAYQKRCPFVIDLVIDIARNTQHRLMIRLVKGAYWDSEIKRAQVDGLEDYPVYTRKAHTDLAYLVCAKKLLDAPDAIYPQFATHNAHSLAAIYKMAGSNYFPGQYEFQCLHGMGEPLYRQVVGPVAQGKLNRPCRIYAPVGSHETLLAYLVRRLLENGANTSFVNRIADQSLTVDSLIEEPIETIRKAAAAEGITGLAHPQIGLPAAMFGQHRENSHGLDLSNEFVLTQLEESRIAAEEQIWTAGPVINGERRSMANRSVFNPSNGQTIIGQVADAGEAEVNEAVTAAVESFSTWPTVSPTMRAEILYRAADLMEAEMVSLIGLLTREAGKTYANAIAEVREAVDFLRFYSTQVEEGFTNDQHQPLGPIVCISPWNFPLAIFTGQVAAALATGNTVLAKPAEQTPLIACRAVRILHEAGVPGAALHLLPGRGELTGTALIADRRIKGVMFTGSTEVAKLIAAQVAGRIDALGQFIPLIAETGGQNAMLVDSSALPEQVVNDVVASAFDSAGQRCSALRILCVQEDVADNVIHMLKGAMSELSIGDPSLLSTDIGPVIDEQAKQIIVNHIVKLGAEGCSVFQAVPQLALDRRGGSFVAPTLIELHQLSQLEREVFGPVLHVVRYARKDLTSLLRQINELGYGLTMGLHTRIDETINQVIDLAKVGNLYVNRNIVGAVVGVQPFGGERLSGTGPKAGGPLYTFRLLSKRPSVAPYAGLKASSIAVAVDESVRNRFVAELGHLQSWGVKHGHSQLTTICQSYARATPSGVTCTLPGPTGERNLYSVLPHELVLCHAQSEQDLVTQLAATVAVGSNALVPRRFQPVVDSLPKSLRDRVTTFEQWQNFHFDAVIYHGQRAEAEEMAQQVIRDRDEIISVIYLPTASIDIPLERLVLERSISINTTAAGGNASLMTID
nr:trifunctional transcriptional regulator/proline dehydrogenase/L-glutamate gamma-semialdehyde dehydrogenase [Pseudomonas sp. R37(2017)]